MDNEMNLNDAQINQVDDQLEHWGIKGMRWGIRRYQNPDGTLTAAGKKRYADEVDKIKAKNAKLDAKLTAKKIADRQSARVKKLKEQAAAKKAQLKGEKIEKKKTQAEINAAKAKAKADKKDKELEDALTRKDLGMQKKKAKILRSGDPVEILKNGHLFNDQEINEAYNRLTAENKIKGLIPEKQSVMFLKQVRDDVLIPTMKNVGEAYLKEKLGLNKPQGKSKEEIAKALTDIEKVKAETAKIKGETENAKSKTKADNAKTEADADKTKADAESSRATARKTNAEASNLENGRKADGTYNIPPDNSKPGGGKGGSSGNDSSGSNKNEGKGGKSKTEKSSKQDKEEDIEYEILGNSKSKSKTESKSKSGSDKIYDGEFIDLDEYDRFKANIAKVNIPKIPASAPIQLLPSPSGGWFPALKSSSGNTSIAALPPATKNQVLQLLEKFD